MRIFLRTPILKDVCERLLLKISASVTNLLKGGRDDDMHLKKGGGGRTESLKNVSHHCWAIKKILKSTSFKRGLDG